MAWSSTRRRRFEKTGTSSGSGRQEGRRGPGRREEGDVRGWNRTAAFGHGERGARDAQGCRGAVQDTAGGRRGRGERWGWRVFVRLWVRLWVEQRGPGTKEAWRRD